MSGFMTSNTDHVTRSNLWSADIKDIFEHEIMGWKYVDMLTDFPDGDTWNIPTVGQLPVLDYEEGQAIRYSKMDTGNFTFTISEYKSSAVAITKKMLQDSYWSGKLTSMFVPKMSRAIATAMETDILAVGPEGQTATDSNTINDAKHRYVGGGTQEVIEMEDFAKAKYALRKAGVPMTNLVAIVDPSVGITFDKTFSMTASAYNPAWERVTETGTVTGMRFIANIMGFDVYESDFLKKLTATEAIDGVTAPVGSACNLFFSAAPEAVPFIGAVRQTPMVESSYNKDLQQEEHVMTARYGVGLYRPEAFVTVITALDQVYA